MTSQTTINQHYVPQFLLRGFDSSEFKKSKVHIFDLIKNEFRHSQSIKEVFSQNHFYDENNEIEKFLSSSIENPASKVINDIRCGNFSTLNKYKKELIQFMCCQHARTIGSREEALSYVQAHFYQTIADLNKLNDWRIGNLEEIKIRPSDRESFRRFIVEHVLNGLMTSAAMEDLEFHILINKTDEDFIISDNPITRYNWLYRELKDFRIGSLLAKGAQFFLPISDRICLCAYDAKIYKYGTKSSSISELYTKKDVRWLNQLQVRNSHSLIAFKSKSMGLELEKLRADFYGKKVYSWKSVNLGQKDTEDSEPKTEHIVYAEQTKLIDKPTFFKILKKSRKIALCFEDRDPNISRALMMLKDKVRNDVGLSKI